MRLLRRKSNDDFELATFNTDDLPPYAILSHTWTDGEVTYDELVAGTGKNKAGYDKIRFCGERATADNLQYFWVDTCCTIQSHHRRHCPTKGVAYAAEDGGGMYIAFKYKLGNISLFSYLTLEILVHPVVRSRIFQCGTKIRPPTERNMSRLEQSR
jgi:hypothetical protein